MPATGLYIHYPFCRTKCPYCDFASVGAEAPEAQLAPRYFPALGRELALRLEAQPDLRGRPLISVYFGGGTPSLASPQELSSLLEAIRAAFVVSPEAEITLEANPGVSDARRLAAFRAVGVNRLSLGVQSFRPADLRALGRSHTAGEARSAIRAARAAGFENLGADLIFGVPGQSAGDFRRNLDELTAFRPEHISVYGLTVYEGTPFQEQARLGTLGAATDDEQAEMFLDARSRLLAGGYLHYEISNHALAGFESRHNRLYWNNGDWIGLGASAHTSIAGRRSENPRSIPQWLRAIDSGCLPLVPEEPPAPQSLLGEAVMLGLRQSCGVSLDDLAQRFGPDAARRAEDAFETFVQEGFVQEQGRRRALTERGLLVADSIMARFF